MSQAEEPQPKRSLAEWVTFSAATFILGIIVSLVIYTWLNDKEQPPILSVTQQENIQKKEGQFYVPFEIVNTGGETAEMVQIIAELKINDQDIQTGEQQIDFLSSGETEKGAFVFKENPSKGKLIIRVASYKLP
ncbi:TIGR02588 family protein [Fortiea contorta]|uniref:TIGR02588 family protein n=1 Tax=Fortiea contorta TaxID=1892405 RepID=UPI00034B32E9|nr:TIGR02588 family protein [Fortiea contorta]